MQSRELLVISAGLFIAGILAGYIIIGFSGIIVPSGLMSPPYQFAPEETPDYSVLLNRTVMLEVPLPESPATVPSYRVVSVEDEWIMPDKTSTVQKNIPSVEEAPALAKNALMSKGKFPPDAVLEKATRSVRGQYDTRTGRVIDEYPLYTGVRYRQQVNGSPVIGTLLEVDLGENGTVVGINKGWATLEYAGDTPIISAGEAFEKLRAQDLMVRLQCCINGFNITRVEHGYYIDNIRKIPSADSQPASTCTPVWIFYAVKPGTGDDPFPLLVNATRVEHG